MSPVIKLAGKSGSSKASTKSSTTRKPAAKKAAPRTRKTAAAKPAAKKTTTRKPAAKAAAPKTNGSSRLNEREQKLIKQHVDSLTKLGSQRRKLDEDLKAKIEEIFGAVQDAQDAGVPMSTIANSLGISRQWLYKMGDFRGRTNGKKKTAPAKAKATSTTRKRGTAEAKPAAKASAGAKRIRRVSR